MSQSTQFSSSLVLLLTALLSLELLLLASVVFCFPLELEVQDEVVSSCFPSEVGLVSLWLAVSIVEVIPRKTDFRAAWRDQEACSEKAYNSILGYKTAPGCCISKRGVWGRRN